MMQRLLLFSFIIYFVFILPIPLSRAVPTDSYEDIDEPLPEPGRVARPTAKPAKPVPAIHQPPPPPDPNAFISEKNLFRPDRKDWVMDDATALGQKDKGPKKERPKLQLFGTIIIDDQKRAIIRMPQPAKGMANKEIYIPGDYIGEYVLQEVEEKKAVLDYYGEKVTLLLSEGKVHPKGDKTEIQPTQAGVARARATQKRLTPVQEAKRAEILKRIEEAKKGIKRPPQPGPDGLIRINPFMSREERKSAIAHNRKILAERRKDAAGGE